MEQTEIHPHHHPEQEELPFARVQGEPFTTPPTDLYIPPDALEVFLDAFEGPLDLLLYLIRRQNLDILDIPIAEITEQYIEHIEMMTDLRLELAAEYLVMAAMLAEIKSRMLLPRTVSEDEEVGDPRAELIRRLQEYERFKQRARELASEHEATFADLGDLVPGELWGETAPTVIGGGMQLDFMHFREGGHQLLAAKIVQLLGRDGSLGTR